MFGPPGHAYVYFAYGMHWCANVVCDRSGRASAVLLRSGELVVGEEVARSRRSSAAPTSRLASGPANLAACLGASGADTGQDVTALGSTLRLRQGAPVPDVAVVAGPRIGVSRGTETPWRFQVAGNPHVSGPRRARG
jgi:DNA-3-methyladenine glycosylase